MADFAAPLNRSTATTPPLETSAEHDGTKWIQNIKVADGDNATLGATTDTKVTNADSAANVIEALKGQLDRLNNILTALQSATPAGDNNIGNVDIVTMPAVAQGTPAVDGSPWPVKVTGSSVPDAQAFPTKVLSTRLTTSPVNGTKSLTTTPAAIFAGSSKLSGRTYVMLDNPNTVTIRVGGSGISTTVGTRLLPGDTRPFPIDPTTNPDVYACMESGTGSTNVEEGK